MQNNGHYAVQGHSRSPILVPTESTYTHATSYVRIIVSYVLSCTLLRYDDWWTISSNFHCCKGVPLFNAVVPATSPECSIANLVSRYLRNVPLSCGAKHISISWTVKVWITGVDHECDRRTDRQTDRLWHNKCHISLGCTAEKWGPRMGVHMLRTLCGGYAHVIVTDR